MLGALGGGVRRRLVGAPTGGGEEVRPANWSSLVGRSSTLFLSMPLRKSGQKPVLPFN